MTATTGTEERDYVLLATTVFVYGNDYMPESLIEAHAPDCARVTGDKAARIVRRATGDGAAAAARVDRTVQEAFNDTCTGGSLAYAMRERGEDPQFVTDKNGTQLWHCGFYVGRCLRDHDKKCFIPEWCEPGGRLGEGDWD